MAHMLMSKDTMMSVRETPWHGLGSVLDDYPKSIDEALRLSGLGWKVNQGTVLVPDGTGDPVQALTVANEIAALYEGGQEIPNASLEQLLAACQGSPAISLAEGYRANRREDDGSVLGIVSDDYKVVQNEEAFKFLDALIASDLYFETAGSLMNGKRVWVLARLPEFIEVAGDQTATFIYVANSHDGSMAVTAAATPIRIVCNNTLSWALRKSEGCPRTYKFRHTGDLQLKYDEARKVIGLTVKYSERFKALGDELGTQRISKPSFQNVLVKLIPIDYDEMGKRAIENRKESRELVMNLFSGNVPGNEATVGNAPGSKWCAANSIAEWADFFGRYTDRTDQMMRSFESRADVKQRGLDLVIAA